VFSTNEFQIARKLAYNTKLTQAEIADEFGFTINTVNTYYKRILEKARDFFQIKFNSLAEVTTYLKRECIL
jgi:DNA-binding transcriptional regulator LsrR (DeoR family)